MNHKIHRIHMVGIGGAGMSGIAEILLQQGYEVTGSDIGESPVIATLRGLGAEIKLGHAPENVGDVQVVVRSTAIGDDNPEIIAARKNRVAIIPRAEMLAELMRLRQGIAIAGTHGKTTTTSFVASIFESAGLDPTVIIGGRLNANGTNARLGSGEFLIAEADESDGSFLCLFPIINIVTNIDEDHLDHYGNRDAIDEAFIQFMNKVPFYGKNIVCGDDAGIKRILSRIKRPVMTYGLEDHNDLRAVVLEIGERSLFEVWQGSSRLGVASLPQPGRHNVLNALGAIAAGLVADIPFAECARGLAAFKGVGRRFERKGEKGGVTVVDDYGHHPAEIAATLATCRDVFPGRRIVVAFQPHRFTRTQALFGDFCHVFELADEALICEIYPASEKPIPGVSGESLAMGIRQVSSTPARYFQSIAEMASSLPQILRKGDVLLTLGAGSITKLGPMWLNS